MITSKITCTETRVFCIAIILLLTTVNSLIISDQSMQNAVQKTYSDSATEQLFATILGKIYAGEFTANDLAKIKKIIANQADVNAHDASGSTPLELAIRRHSLNLAKLLLLSGADKEALSQSNNTPLGEAVIYGSAPLVQLLLESGANPRVPLGNGWTLLFYAAHYGFTDKALLLLKAGVPEKDRAAALKEAQMRATHEPEKAKVARLLALYPHHEQQEIAQENVSQNTIIQALRAIGNYATAHKIAVTALAAAAATLAALYGRTRQPSLITWRESLAYIPPRQAA